MHSFYRCQNRKQKDEIPRWMDEGVVVVSKHDIEQEAEEEVKEERDG